MNNKSQTYKRWYENNKDYFKKYREQNKAKIYEYSRQYRELHKQKMKEYWEKYKKDNEDKIKARRKAYYIKNKAKTSEYNKKWIQNNRDKMSKYYRAYRKRHLEERRARDRISQFNHRTEISIRNGRRPEFSPNQNEERKNLTLAEKHSITAILSSAQPQARKDNSSSSKKGVSWDKHRNKWVAYLTVKKSRIIKRFDTEQEAILYREYLENKYYTEEQLKIRDKYKKEA